MNNFEIMKSGNDAVTSFCTMTANTVAEKKALYNATSGKAERLVDQVNKIIYMAHIYAEPTTLQDVDENGEKIVKQGVRVIVIDKDGNAYSTASTGIVSSISRIFNIFGMPDEWGEPLPVMVKRVDCKRGNTYVIEVVE